MTFFMCILKKDSIRISTHTLTWSVTMEVMIMFCSMTNFNSHAHVERDY